MKREIRGRKEEVERNRKGLKEKEEERGGKEEGR